MTISVSKDVWNLILSYLEPELPRYIVYQSCVYQEGRLHPLLVSQNAFETVKATLDTNQIRSFVGPVRIQILQEYCPMGIGVIYKHTSNTHSFSFTTTNTNALYQVHNFDTIIYKDIDPVLYNRLLSHINKYLLE